MTTAPAESERSWSFLWPFCLSLTLFAAVAAVSCLVLRPRLVSPAVGKAVVLLWSRPLLEENATAATMAPWSHHPRHRHHHRAITSVPPLPDPPPVPLPPANPFTDASAQEQPPSPAAVRDEEREGSLRAAVPEAGPDEDTAAAPESEPKVVSYRPVPTPIPSLLNWSDCTHVHRGPPFLKSPLVQVVTVEHFWNGHSQRVLLNFILHTPADWGFFFLHEPALVPTLPCTSPLWPYIVSGKVQFAPVPYLVRHQIPELNRQSYQGVLKSAEFWGSFAAEFILIYERDTVLCSNPTMDWDHFLRDVKAFSAVVLGAPWHPSRHPVAKCCNGGLALVNRHLLTFILRRKDPKDSSWDNHIATALTVWHHKGVKARAPPLALSCKFSVETFYPGTYTPVGVHAPWMMLRYNSPARVRELIRQCPEVRLLRSVAHVKSRGRRLGTFLKLLNEDHGADPLPEEAIAPN
eukprot:EG_transcript_8052